MRVGFSRGETLLVLGQRFQLPATLVLRLNRDELLIPDVQLVGAAGGTLKTAGKIGMSGLIDMGVAVHEFPLGRLPGLAQTDLPFGGRLNGRLLLSGDRGRQVVTGQMSVDEVTLAGRHLGVGKLVITPGPGRNLRQWAPRRRCDGAGHSGTGARRRSGVRRRLSFTTFDWIHFSPRCQAVPRRRALFPAPLRRGSRRADSPASPEASANWCLP